MVHNSSIEWTDRKSAILAAKKFVDSNAVFLDMETTGLGKSDEIVEISIIDIKGRIIITGAYCNDTFNVNSQHITNVIGDLNE